METGFIYAVTPRSVCGSPSSARTNSLQTNYDPRLPTTHQRALWPSSTSGAGRLCDRYLIEPPDRPALKATAGCHRRKRR
jgi:hypothetical protein